MPKKKYIVTLTPEERSYLEKLVKTGKNSAFKVNHARILLLADTADVGSAWKDEDMILNPFRTGYEKLAIFKPMIIS